MIDPKILPRKEWEIKVDFDCGCEAECFELKKDRTPKENAFWTITNFCEDHDPTIEH